MTNIRFGALFRRVTAQPHLILAIGIGAFYLGSFAASSVRLLELEPGAYDLGLYQQALWTGAHGGTFYESPDFQTPGYPSFFFVHLAALMYLLAPLYAAAPSALTLFVLQSGALALAAIPLFLFARDVSGRAGTALAVAGLYLVWAPLLGGALFDFHLEAFVPVELFSLCWLWRRGRYVAALPAVVAAFATGEFAVPFVALLGLYFAFLPIGGESNSSRQTWVGAVAEWIRRPSTQVSLGLAAASAAFLAGLFWLQADVLTSPFNAAAVGGSPAPPGLSFLGFTHAYEISLGNLGLDFAPKLAAWVVLYALVGFLPWFAPRSQLILSVPWVAFTLLAPADNYARLGFQYSFLAAVPIFVGVTEGLPRFLGWIQAPLPVASPPAPRTGARTSSGRIRRRALLAGLAVALVVANLAAGPLDPSLEGSGSLGSGYQLVLPFTPGYSTAASLAGMVPPGAVLLASERLFPLVANSPATFLISPTVPPMDRSHLPFGPMRPPAWVLVDQADLPAVPSWLAEEVYNHSQFALAGVGWGTPAGTALLFHSATDGPTGPPQWFGDSPTAPGEVHLASLTLGPAGVWSSPGNAASSITEVPGESGNIWHGPYTSLPPGKYAAVLNLTGSAWPLAPAPGPGAIGLEVTIDGWGQPAWSQVGIPLAALNASTPTTISVPFNVTAPSTDVEVVGDVAALDLQLTLAQLEIVSWAA